MPNTFLTVKSNTAPAIQIQLKRRGTPIDISGATVTLIIKSKKTKSIVNTDHQSCIIVDPTDGIISYTPAIGDFQYTNSDYEAEVKVVYSGGGVETIYEKIIINSRPRLTDS